MSLFNKVGAQLANSTDNAAGGTGIGGVIGQVGTNATRILGGGALAATTAGIGEVMVGNAVQGAIHARVPAVVRTALHAGGGAVGDLMQGNWNAAGLRLLDAGLVDAFFLDHGHARTQARYWATPTPLFGGITPMQARAIYAASRAETFARKNLWLLEVSNAAGVTEGKFNLFATEVEYAPSTLTGEKRRVGAAVVDAVTGGEAVELRIVTMDDASGTLKQWFAQQCALVEHPDGTVGVPADYQVGIRILHGVVSATQRVAYEDKGLFRPASIEYALSRREDGMQELQMSFTQLDTFMK